MRIINAIYLFNFHLFHIHHKADKNITWDDESTDPELEMYVNYKICLKIQKSTTDQVKSTIQFPLRYTLDDIIQFMWIFFKFSFISCINLTACVKADKIDFQVIGSHERVNRDIAQTQIYYR